MIANTNAIDFALKKGVKKKFILFVYLKHLRKRID